MMWVEKCDNRRLGEMRVRRRDTRIWFVVLSVFVAVFLFTFLRQNYKNTDEVEAANLANFDPGYIISDYQMENYSAMTEAEIQKFLTAKNPCNNRDQDSYEYLVARYPNLTWHFENGHFVCLSEELFGDGEVIGEGETAAHIIWQAAQDYHINPQVLIVLLQKEQGLITDSYPNSRQYRAATGYGCPDTAACSSKYYGFKNQVRNAASMFRTVLNGGWTNYPLGENYIQYNPSASCGGSVVNVRNLATSALYRYTPYQPNEGALAAGYGTAYCGAYGNRNFYLYFEDWFGGITNEMKVDSVEEVEIEVTNGSAVIEEGFYKLVSKAYNGMVIDIKGGVYEGMMSGETLIYNDKKNVSEIANQVFKFELNDGTDYYSIINPTSGVVLDVNGGSTKDLTPIIVWKKHSGCNQSWSMEKDESGYYMIVSKCSGKVLNVTKDGQLVLYKKNNSDNQKWQLVPVQVEKDMVANGTYQIVTGNDTAMDIKGGINNNTKTGEIIEYKKKELSDKSVDNQLFKIEFDNERQAYRIYNELTGLVLTSGNFLTIGEEKGNCSTRWVINKDSSGIYKIFSLCGGVIGGSIKQNDGLKRITVGNNSAGWWLVQSVKDESLLGEKKNYQLVFGGKALDIFSGISTGMKRGSLILYTIKQTGLDNQTFSIKYNKNTDDYLIYNPVTNLYLDVENVGTKNNSNVILYSYNGGCNQRWKIKNVNNEYEISSVCSGKKLGINESVKIGGFLGLIISDQETAWSFKENK